uniref:Uncharacterized protein n=1 Tax=Chlamydomonas euryale TaxID=1486919 RepID=A0A7R9YR96_9CHLO|mmetsp:Transcript_16350/g.48717  ORF Transcript_16350/g.48717 Transcript_16350/m.48717 type:complete len:597 (+) Transcript_16350:772-2562(+)
MQLAVLLRACWLGGSAHGDSADEEHLPTAVAAGLKTQKEAPVLPQTMQLPAQLQPRVQLASWDANTVIPALLATNGSTARQPQQPAQLPLQQPPPAEADATNGTADGATRSRVRVRSLRSASQTSMQRLAACAALASASIRAGDDVIDSVAERSRVYMSFARTGSFTRYSGQADLQQELAPLSTHRSLGQQAAGQPTPAGSAPTRDDALHLAADQATALDLLSCTPQPRVVSAFCGAHGAASALRAARAEELPQLRQAAMRAGAGDQPVSASAALARLSVAYAGPRLGSEAGSERSRRSCGSGLRARSTLGGGGSAGPPSSPRPDDEAVNQRRVSDGLRGLRLSNRLLDTLERSQALGLLTLSPATPHTHATGGVRTRRSVRACASFHVSARAMGDSGDGAPSASLHKVSVPSSFYPESSLGSAYSGAGAPASSSCRPTGASSGHVPAANVAPLPSGAAWRSGLPNRAKHVSISVSALPLQGGNDSMGSDGARELAGCASAATMAGAATPCASPQRSSCRSGVSAGSPRLRHGAAAASPQSTGGQALERMRQALQFYENTGEDLLQGVESRLRARHIGATDVSMGEMEALMRRLRH